MKDPLRVRQKQGASSYGWDSPATPQNDREGEENDREGEECREKNGDTERHRDAFPAVRIITFTKGRSMCRFVNLLLFISVYVIIQADDFLRRFAYDSYCCVDNYCGYYRSWNN